MYIKKLIFFLAIFLMALPNCFSQQFTYPWNFMDSTGSIQDMHFMPDDSEFIYTTTGNMIRVRNTETAELKREWPGVQGTFGFTADNKQIVVVNDKKIDVRNLSDMSLVASDSLQLGADTLDPVWHTRLEMRFLGMVVDPIKPFAYTLIQKTNNHGNQDRVDTVWVVVYNYQTMKQIKTLTAGGFNTHYERALLAVSKDGKYLTAMSDGATYLQVWDIPSLSRVKNVPLFDTVNFSQKPGDYWCYPQDLKFSDLNTDIIYFSGNFPKVSGGNQGLLIYDLLKNKITYSTSGGIGRGSFSLFDNENKLIYVNGLNKYILNLDSNYYEFVTEMHYPDPGTWGDIIYSKNFDLFIGWCSEYCSSGIYDRGSSVYENIKVPKKIYPNPTSSIITIETSCNSLSVDYKILKPNGDLVIGSTAENTNNSIQIDFSTYPNGVYFLTLTCGMTNITYKVIKEG